MTNLAHYLAETAKRSPDHPAISFEGATTTYGGLAEQANRAAKRLTEEGIGRGDRVALWLPNHPAFASAMYAVWQVGAIVVPVHAALTKPETRHILTDAGVKAAFCGQDQIEAGAEELLHELGIFAFVLPGDAPDGADGSGAVSSDAAGIADVTDEDLALIAYTSGTSGLPKGAMLTHKNLRTNIEQMRASPIAVSPEDVVLCVLPLFHIFGLNVVLNLSVSVGAKIVLMERFDPKASVEAISKEAVTVIAGAPPVYVAWLDSPPESFANVRIAISGAAPLSKDVLEQFRERFGVTIWEGYGLTETSPALTFTGIGGVAKPGSIGRPLDGVELRLIDQDGDDVEDGDPGEIVVRGPNVFGGYWNNPEHTEQAFVDGWFRTGDVGVADDDGDLYIVDRRKDLIIVSGFNVYPREVEEVLRRHPNVGDCAVVGDQDDQTGEQVRAVVVPDPPGSSLTEEEVIEFCSRSLAPYKLPRTVEIVSAIPRNATGKVVRRKLKQQDAP